MKKQPGQPVRAAGILLMMGDQNDKQFLLMRHPTRWDLPKGHCEEGESFQQAALRETEEETGIPPDRISIDPDFEFELRYQVTYRKTGDQTFEKQVRYYLGYLEGPIDLKLTEHESAQWFPWAPPHEIQAQTIDPLLAAVADHFGRT